MNQYLGENDPFSYKSLKNNFESFHELNADVVCEGRQLKI